MTYRPGQRTNTMSLIGMICGIVGLMGTILCCCSPIIAAGWCGLFGLISTIFGFMGKSQIEQSRGEETGKEMAITALVLGIIQLVFAVIGVILFVLSLMGLIALPILEEMLYYY